jgi:hypothetical protein
VEGEYGGVVACPGEQRLNGGRRFPVGGGCGSCCRRGPALRAVPVSLLVRRCQRREGERGALPAWRPGAHAREGGAGRSRRGPGRRRKKAGKRKEGKKRKEKEKRKQKKKREKGRKENEK